MNAKNTPTPSERSARFADERLTTAEPPGSAHADPDQAMHLPASKVKVKSSISLLPAWLHLMVP